MHLSKKSSIKTELSVLVWDSDDSCPSFDGSVILWRSTGQEKTYNETSILEVVEQTPDIYKKKYLEWVYSLGKLKINRQSLVESLKLRPHFSYWWLTLLSEKCNVSKSPQIDNAIKLMAFESLVVANNITNIKIVTSNYALAMCIKKLCFQNKISFAFQKLPFKVNTNSLFRRIYESQPTIIKAIIWFTKHLIEHWPYRGYGVNDWLKSKGKVTFISYFFNLDQKYINDGIYKSSYWGTLPDLLVKEKCQTNWIHMCIKHPMFPDVEKSYKAIDQLNAKECGYQTHVMLEAFLSMRIVFLTIFDWVIICIKSYGLRNLFGRRFINTEIFSQLFKEDWKKSIFGIEAISNLLLLNLYESALKKLSPQDFGAYLLENQGWERSLNYAWKVNGHRTLVGAAHSSIRYWDLRYFFDPRQYYEENFPKPNLMAVNGQKAKDECLAGGYPQNQICEVEALRYLSLSEEDEEECGNQKNKKKFRVLVLGDYSKARTDFQLSMLSKAASNISLDITYIVRAHLNCPIDARNFPGIKLCITEKPINELLKISHIVYASSATTAALDAYSYGLRVICALDNQFLNQSPLRGCDNVTFVSSPVELAQSLNEVKDLSREESKLNQIFFIDENLTRWKKLILKDG
jgi:surface carbohydrate biosynthesis protein (TIGR04326 family)